MENFPPVRLDVAASVDWVNGAVSLFAGGRCLPPPAAKMLSLDAHDQLFRSIDTTRNRGWRKGLRTSDGLLVIGNCCLLRFAPLRHKAKNKDKVKVKVVGAAHTCQRLRLWTPQGAEGPLTPAKPSVLPLRAGAELNRTGRKFLRWNILPTALFYGML